MKAIILSILILIAVTSCTKDETKPKSTTGRVTFYMSMTQYHWNLIVDGTEYGALRGTPIAPPCGDGQYITLTLETGSHSIDAKSLDGFAWGDPKTYNVTEGCNTYKVR